MSIKVGLLVAVFLVAITFWKMLLITQRTSMPIILGILLVITHWMILHYLSVPTLRTLMPITLRIAMSMSMSIPRTMPITLVSLA